MADMSAVIAPKSDQINAEDFITGPRTYTIENVQIKPGQDQPVNIRLHGEKRVWRPCKSMCRVLVAAWGADASKYAGRSVTLYGDPSVTWGGMAVGGIRISHMTHIDREVALALTATRGKKQIFKVKPLAQPEAKAAVVPVADDDPSQPKRYDKALARAIEAINGVETIIDLQAKFAQISRFREWSDEEYGQIDTAYKAKEKQLKSK